MSKVDTINKLLYASYDRQGRNTMDGIYYSVSWSYLIALL